MRALLLLVLLGCSSFPKALDVSHIERGEPPTATKRTEEIGHIREVHEIVQAAIRKGPGLCGWHVGEKEEPNSIRFDLSDGSHVWVFGQGGVVQNGGCYQIGAPEAARLRTVAKYLDITGP